MNLSVFIMFMARIEGPSIENDFYVPESKYTLDMLESLLIVSTEQVA